MGRYILLLAGTAWLCAQEERLVPMEPLPTRTPTRYVSGRIVEGSTGEPLPGVLVRLGTQGTYSDAKGSFSVPFTQPDTLRALLSGYRELRVPIRQPVTDLLLRMNPIETELEAVQIIDDAPRETELGAFLERLRSLEIGELYSQELIMRRSTDFYVPNVLRRLPGVSILSGRFVSIRGLAERYNAFAFWAAYPAWITYDASFGELEQLITTLLGRVEVRKFWTPELLGHFGGGMVDFQLPSPAESGLQVAFTSETDFGAVGRPFAQFRGKLREPIPKSFPDPATVQASENAGRPLPENFTYGRQVQRYTIPDTLPWAPPGALLTLSYNLRREKWGLALRGAFSQRYLSSQFRFLDGVFTQEGNTWVFEPSTESTSTNPLHIFSRGGGASWHAYWIASPKHTFTLEGFFLASTQQKNPLEEAYYINPDIDSVQPVYSWYPPYYTSRGHIGILRPAWEFRAGSWQAKLQLGLLSQSHAIPQAGAMNYVRYPNTSALVYEHELYGEQEIYAQVWTSTTQANQLYAHPFVERRWTKPWGWWQIRIGGWASWERQRFQGRQLGFLTDTAGGGPNLLDPNVYAIEAIRNVYDPTYVRPGGWYLIDRTGDFHRHRGETDLLAGYSWVRLALQDRFEGLLGVRYEDWRRTIWHIPVATARETLAARPADSHWLPALLLKYRFSERHSVRAGANATLIRTPLPSQVPLRYFDYFFSIYWQGDLSLRTGRSLNFDARYEWLRSRNQLLAIGTFYKQLRDLPEIYLVPASYNLTYTYATRNRDRGEVLGIEIEARQPIYEVGRARLWSYATLTLSESAAGGNILRKVGRLEGRLQGHAPIVCNLGLLYERRRYELAAFATYTSAQIWAIGFDPYIYPNLIEEGRLLAEAQFTYRFSDRWEARIAIWDFVNQPYRRTQRLANANTFNTDRDAVGIWERQSYRGYLTIRYRLGS